MRAICRKRRRDSSLAFRLASTSSRSVSRSTGAEQRGQLRATQSIWVALSSSMPVVVHGHRERGRRLAAGAPDQQRRQAQVNRAAGKGVEEEVVAVRLTSCTSASSRCGPGSADHSA